jgi:hypothetical protein
VVELLGHQRGGAEHPAQSTLGFHDGEAVVRVGEHVLSNFPFPRSAV